MILALYRIIAFCLWFGVMLALITVALAAALVAVIGAAVFGALSPSRTPRATLAALYANTSAAVAQVRALRPH